MKFRNHGLIIFLILSFGTIATAESYDPKKIDDLTTELNKNLDLAKKYCRSLNVKPLDPCGKTDFLECKSLAGCKLADKISKLESDDPADKEIGLRTYQDCGDEADVEDIDDCINNNKKIKENRLAWIKRNIAGDSFPGCKDPGATFKSQAENKEKQKKDAADALEKLNKELVDLKKSQLESDIQFSDKVASKQDDAHKALSGAMQKSNQMKWQTMKQINAMDANAQRQKVTAEEISSKRKASRDNLLTEFSKQSNGCYNEAKTITDTEYNSIILGPQLAGKGEQRVLNITKGGKEQWYKDRFLTNKAACLRRVKDAFDKASRAEELDVDSQMIQLKKLQADAAELQTGRNLTVAETSDLKRFLDSEPGQIQTQAQSESARLTQQANKKSTTYKAQIEDLNKRIKSKELEFEIARNEHEVYSTLSSRIPAAAGSGDNSDYMGAVDAVVRAEKNTPSKCEEGASDVATPCGKWYKALAETQGCSQKDPSSTTSSRGISSQSAFSSTTYGESGCGTGYVLQSQADGSKRCAPSKYIDQSSGKAD